MNDFIPFQAGLLSGPGPVRSHTIEVALSGSAAKDNLDEDQSGQLE